MSMLDVIGRDRHWKSLCILKKIWIHQSFVGTRILYLILSPTLLWAVVSFGPLWFKHRFNLSNAWREVIHGLSGNASNILKYHILFDAFEVAVLFFPLLFHGRVKWILRKRIHNVTIRSISNMLWQWWNGGLSMRATSLGPLINLTGWLSVHSFPQKKINGTTYILFPFLSPFSVPYQMEHGEI